MVASIQPLNLASHLKIAKSVEAKKWQSPVSRCCLYVATLLNSFHSRQRFFHQGFGFVFTVNISGVLQVLLPLLPLLPLLAFPSLSLALDP
jgi:hypothetical protein